MRLGTPVGNISENDSVVDVHPPSGEHTAMAQLADTERLDLDEVQITRFHQFVAGVRREEVSVLMETGTGAPLAVEKYVGRGRIILQALPLGLEWSNIPLTRAYVVMVHDWLAYLTQPAATQFNLSPGGPITMVSTTKVADAEARLTTPDGRTIGLLPFESDAATSYRYAQTQGPGPYSLKFIHGAKTIAQFPYWVRRDPRESDLARLADEERAWLAKEGGIRFSNEVDMTVTQEAQVPKQKSLWGLLLTIVLMCLIVELLLSNLSARRRYAGVMA